MSASDAELVKNGKLTTFYMRLLDNVNKKLDKKIDVMSETIMTEFEKKKSELIKTKKQLEDLYRMRTSIEDINKFYKYPKVESKKDIKSLHFDNKPSNPNITNINLLDLLENVNVKVENGDYIQLVQKTTSPVGANPSLLIQHSDKPISAYTRFSIKKKSNIVQIDNKQSGFETSPVNIVVHFKGYRVNPEFINIRYLTLPNEPKQIFSYINNVMGSNDGLKWELVCNINLSMMRNFEKATLFKYPVQIKTTQFYEYLCFQSQATKEAIPKEHLSKISNRAKIPICNFEIFGNYYTSQSNNVNKPIVEDFQKFFDEYVNTTYSSASNKTELEYLVKMTLEAYKELSDVITECKLNNAKSTIDQNASTNSTESEYIDNLDNGVLEITYEPQVPEYTKEPEEGEIQDTPFFISENKEDDLDADLMDLMNNTRKTSTNKQIKILDTETSSITLSKNGDKQKKKKMTK
jgi:hypothetical protein